MLECRAVVLRIWSRRRAHRLHHRSVGRPEVRLEGDPQRGDDEVVPAAVSPIATNTPDVPATGLLGAQRARAIALS